MLPSTDTTAFGACSVATRKLIHLGCRSSAQQTLDTMSGSKACSQRELLPARLYLTTKVHDERGWMDKYSIFGDPNSSTPCAEDELQVKLSGRECPKQLAVPCSLHLLHKCSVAFCRFS